MNRFFLDTLRRTDAFLASLGWLTGEPRVERFFAAERTSPAASD
jgi:hypothetical protein